MSSNPAPSVLLPMGPPSVARKGRSLRSLVVPVGKVVADLGAVGLAMLAAFALKVALPGPDPKNVGFQHFVVALVSLPAWLVVLWRNRLYSPPHVACRLDEFRRVVRASFAGVGAVALASFALKIYVARGWLVLAVPLAAALLTLERHVIRQAMAGLRAKGRCLRSVLIVGTNVEALAMTAMLLEAPALGYRPAGFVADGDEVGRSVLDGIPMLGPVAETLALARQVHASGVVLVTTAVDSKVSNRLVRELTDAGLHVELTSSLCDIALSRLVVRPLGRFPVVHIDAVNLHGWRAAAKRCFDLVFASLALLVLSPLLLPTALAIKLTSPGAVVFRQKRVGLHGQLFEILKFRTMVMGAELMAADLRARNEASGPLFKMDHDPRCTRVGRILRAVCIDEIPQFWNVLRGEMSLVGPRPAIPDELNQWTPELHQRLRVRPGITGIWQVSGGGRWDSFEDYVRLDLYYVDNWSFWTDMAILARTVPSVVFNRRGR